MVIPMVAISYLIDLLTIIIIKDNTIIIFPMVIPMVKDGA